MLKLEDCVNQIMLEFEECVELNFVGLEDCVQILNLVVVNLLDCGYSGLDLDR